ncbi:DUF4411 family protein [Pseudomonas sp. NY15437]|uniref:DUF4411 family protein n=1 Tax=Pseudomonas sp. NY15437 TaxID=3400360 RepID=UPI003A879EF1
MWAFDASSMIYAWDNYPKEHFPALWKWLENQVFFGTLQMPDIAFEEVSHKAPDCGKWLEDNEIATIIPNTEILRCAAELKSLLGIVGDKYGAGVGENDLIIIASAEHKGFNLVSNEKIQIDLPKVLSKYKIPAVCKIKKPPTYCIDFLEYIKQSKATF